MIYLIGKIVLSLLASLGIGFGMAWALQMHLAARLREQLNSVIFETKSRIPALESEITNRDQVIDGLREDLAKKPKQAPMSEQPNNKEQAKQIDALRQQVIDLENDLRLARGERETESLLELTDEDRHHEEEPELMSDDEFLTDIQDIFEDTDTSETSAEAVDSPNTDSESSASTAATEQQDRQSLEDELQNELDGWENEDNSNAKPDQDQIADTDPKKKPLPPKRQVKKKPTKKPSELNADASARAEDSSTDINELLGEVESLSEARKQLNDIVDSQAKEMSSMQQQSELQNKSLSVLNQQLELARMANERILRELREVKDANPSDGDKTRSASGG